MLGPRDGTARTHLPAYRITGNGRKTSVPQPAQNIDRGLNTSVLRFWVVRIRLLLGRRHDGIPFLRHSNADKEDVTFLEGDVALLGDFQDL